MTETVKSGERGDASKNSPAVNFSPEFAVLNYLGFFFPSSGIDALGIPQNLSPEVIVHSSQQ